jgi:hypothetical protein
VADTSSNVEGLKHPESGAKAENGQRRNREEDKTMAHMRRIVMFNRVTADGYFAGADGNLNWVVPEPELDQSASASFTAASSWGVGRACSKHSGHTPRTIPKLHPTPYAAGRRSEDIRAMADFQDQRRRPS